MAHPLRGKKRMDEAEANRLAERLGSPTGWLDQPRSAAEDESTALELLRKDFCLKIAHLT